MRAAREFRCAANVHASAGAIASNYLARRYSAGAPTSVVATAVRVKVNAGAEVPPCTVRKFHPHLGARACRIAATVGHSKCRGHHSRNRRIAEATAHHFIVNLRALLEGIRRTDPATKHSSTHANDVSDSK